MFLKTKFQQGARIGNLLFAEKDRGNVTARWRTQETYASQYLCSPVSRIVINNEQVHSYVFYDLQYLLRGLDGAHEQTMTDERLLQRIDRVFFCAEQKYPYALKRCPHFLSVLTSMSASDGSNLVPH